MATVARQHVVSRGQFARPAVELRSRRAVLSLRMKKKTQKKVNSVFIGDKGGGDFAAPGGDLNANDIKKEAAKRMRQEAARRTARSAAGVARAEIFRVGLEQRSAYTVVDFLSTSEVIGPENNDKCSPASSGSSVAPGDAAGVHSFVCIDALAKSFGLGPAGVDPETDEDRAHLKKLAQRMDASAQRALLYSSSPNDTTTTTTAGAGEGEGRVWVGAGAGAGAALRATVISSLLVDGSVYLQRFAVTADGGEEAVLTLRMTLEERLAPDYKSATIFEQWVVHSVTGEPADAALPTKPERRHPPEAIVDAQLAALRDGDAALVRRFASPRNVAATGPFAMFRKMLASPQYAPLSDPDGASRTSILKTAQLSRDSFVELVEVTSAARGGATFYYLWLLGRQPEKAERVAGFPGQAVAVGGGGGGGGEKKYSYNNGGGGGGGGGGGRGGGVSTSSSSYVVAPGEYAQMSQAYGGEDVSGCWMTDAVTAVQPADLVAFGL